MAQILRIPGSEHLNLSSHSPFTRLPRTPTLGLLPWKQGRAGCFGNKKARFGTPGYPSPLDRFRCKPQDSPLGQNASFSHLPRVSSKRSGLHHAASVPRLSVMPGNGLHSFSFSPGLSKGSFGVSENVPGGQWLFKNFVGGGSCGPVFPTAIVNPNKAVLTLDSSSRILTANDMSSLLLGHPEDKLCGKMKLTDFITHPKTHETLSSLSNLSPTSETDSSDCSLHTLPEPDILENQGMVLFSGKVVDVNTCDNGVLPCSLWLKGLSQEAEEEQRWIAVLEPVDITVAKASVDETGRILKHDPSFNSLFGYADNSELNKLNIQDLIPAIKVPEPSKNIPKDIEKQQCTGQTVDCATFPLCAHFTQDPTQFDQVVKKIVFDLEIWVFSNISGLVVLDGSGDISDYNHNFTRLLFGYGKKELQGAAITRLIPTFFEDVALIQKMSSPSFGSDQSDSAISDNEVDNQKENSKQVSGSLTSLSKSSGGVTANNSEQSSVNMANCAFLATDSNQGSLFSSTINSSNNCSSADKTETPLHVSNAMRDITNSMNVINLSQQNTSSQTYTSNIQASPSKTRLRQNQLSTPIKSLPKVQTEACQDLSQSLLPTDMVTSTPAVGRNKVDDLSTIEEGSFFGVGKHRDGSDLVIIYQIRRVELNGSPHYCVWILRDPEEPAEGLRSNVSFTLASTFSENAECSLGHAIKVQAQGENHVKDDDGDSSSDEENDNSQTSTDGSSGAEYSLNHSRRGNREASTTSGGPDENEEKLLAGDFIDHYTVLRQIGKGAFGCVKMSYRNTDGLLVVTKFIKKNKVYQDSWVNDILLRKKVPLEVSLLMTLDHPNIVSVLDLFENDDYFQLVMEKWGAGMDLFEFIDRNPILDEPLAAYIFRQIVSALAYLHDLNIIHRDVKDENVILDNQFHVKLIDFGSSAFTKPGKMFSQFAGTVEYCSPEVLKGNKYSGYELEVWSLGVTLYTLMYGENPFYDVDETIKADLTFPVVYSDDMCSLLTGMLKKDVKARMTLPQVDAHPWTKQTCDIENYKFQDVVRCSYDEIYPKKYITDYSESDTSLSTTSHSFVYEDAQATRRSLSFTPQGSRNDNDSVRMQRSATSLSSSRITSEISEEDSLYDPSVSIGASRSSTSQSMSSVRSTITVDSSSFSCCSPSSESTDNSDSSTQLDSTPSSVSVTCYDNLSSSSNTLSQQSSEESSSLDKLFTKYHRFDTSEYANDSDYENVRESDCDLSDYENVKDASDLGFEIKINFKESDDDDDGMESPGSLANVLSERNGKPVVGHSDEEIELEGNDYQFYKNENSCITVNSSEGACSLDACELEVKGLNSSVTSCDNLCWYEGDDGPVDSASSVSNDTSNSLWDDLDTP